MAILGRRLRSGSVWPFLFGVVGCALAPAADWSQEGYQFRRQIFLGSAPAGRAAPAAHLRFWHRGALRKDGYDLRVTEGGGKVLPHELLRLGPGDQVELLIGLESASRSGTLQVYFGNPAAARPREYLARAGVVLEIRKRGQGGCESWPDYQRLFEASTEVLGRILRTRIFDGCNPLGPSADFLSYYRAWFQVERSGEHCFATNSDDASFLLVDGRLVAQYPGIHGPEATSGQRQGKILLDPGPHKLEYYHLQAGQGTATVAAWQRPGDPHLALMREEHFVPVLPARAGDLERADGRRILDFSCQPFDSLSVEGAHLVRYAFQAPAALGNALAWDFGDGTRAGGPQGPAATGPHLYLAPGEYRVTLSAPGGQGLEPVTQRVVVEPLWAQRELFSQPLWEETYLPVLRARLAGETPQSAALANLIPFAAGLEDEALIQTLAACAWPQRERFRPAERARLFCALALHLQQGKGDQEEAERAFREALRGGEDRAAIARAALHYAGLLLHRKGKTREAFELLEALDRQALPSEADRRLLKILRADCLAGLGRGAEALAAYEPLSEGEGPRAENRLRALQRRARLLRIEDALRRGAPEEALKSLDQLEWETPRERLNGETALLRVKAYLDQKQYSLALVRLGWLQQGDPASGRLPEILYLEMKAHQGLGRWAEFEAAHARLKKEFPYAEETAWASLLKGPPAPGN